MPRMPLGQVVTFAVPAVLLVFCIVFLRKTDLPPASSASRRAGHYTGLLLERIVTEPAIEPWGVSPGPGNEILVTDRLNNDLLVFDPTGRLLASARRLDPDAPPVLSEPTGLCHDRCSGNIFVADSGHNRVAVFDSRARFLFAFTHGFRRPAGIASDGSGRIFVVSVDDACLRVFDTKGRFIDSKSSKQLGMSYLWDIACLPGGGFVLTSALGGLTMYDGNFKPVCCLAERGSGPGYYLFTTGCDADSAGRVLVCAKTQGKVMLLGPPTTDSPRGSLIAEVASTDGPFFSSRKTPMLASYGTFRAERKVADHMLHSIRYPMDAAFLGKGRIAIAERGNRRILIFRELGKG